MAKNKPVKIRQIDLTGLNPAEKEIWKEAKEHCSRNMNCWNFLYWAERSYKLILDPPEEIMTKPLFIAIRELWYQLGVRQGIMSRYNRRTEVVIIE